VEPRVREEPAPPVALGSARTRYSCQADLTALGSRSNDHIGFAMGSLGPDGRADWNGDGKSDLLLGSYQKIDVPNPGETTIPTATLILSPWSFAAPLLARRAQVQLRLEDEAGTRFGRSVAWLGDLDGDNHSDFCVGDIRGPKLDGAWSERGRVFLYLSSDPGTGLASAKTTARVPALRASLILEGEFQGARFGHALHGLGDYDGDGVGDLLVGAPGSFITRGYAGRAFVFSGKRLLEARAAGAGAVQPAEPLALWSEAGAAPLDGFGYTVARVEAGVFAVGAPQLTFDPKKGLAPETGMEVRGPGYVRVFGAGLERLEGGARGDLFGFSLGAADLDGDGRRELVVGAPGAGGAEGERVGQVLVFDTREPRAAPRLVLRGGARLEMFGWSVGGYGPAPASAGELLAAGSFGYMRLPERANPCAGLVMDRSVPQAGRLQLFSPAGQALFAVIGERNADSAGASFAYLGDLDGSGAADLVLSAFRWDEAPPRNDVGKVCVFRDPLR
jgi:hypothetical protein